MKNRLEEFIERRTELIDRLDAQQISKAHFIMENFLLIDRLSMVPFLQVMNYEQALYNYHYYNHLAKYWNNIAQEQKRKNFKKSQKSWNKSRNYYAEKDKSIRSMLELQDMNMVEAYYISMHSKKLQNNLVEIVLKDKKQCILHTMNQDIITFLKQKEVLAEEQRKSLIDSYVNTGY